MSIDIVRTGISRPALAAAAEGNACVALMICRTSTDAKFVSARVSGGSTFSVAGRDTVFTDDYVYAANPHANYDVLPDGEHFLFLKPASEGNMIVAANWGSFMRARMAGKEVH